MSPPSFKTRPPANDKPPPSWPCYVVKALGKRHNYRYEHNGERVRFAQLKVGAMWFKDGVWVVKLPNGRVSIRMDYLAGVPPRCSTPKYISGTYVIDKGVLYQAVHLDWSRINDIFIGMLFPNQTQ